MERLKDEINSIKDEKIRKLTIYLLELAPKTFWTHAASSSGYHHPPQSNGEGGLVQHTKMICSMVPIICRAYDMKHEERDEIMCAALLHDIHKHSYTHAIDTSNWMYSDEILLKIRESNPDVLVQSYGRIADMIKMHMGRWTKVPHSKGIEKYTTQEWILHLADMVVTNQKIYFKWD